MTFKSLLIKMKSVLAPVPYKYLLQCRNFSFTKALSQLPYTAIAGPRINDFCSDKLPEQAQVIICGGGIVGTSVAYHLAKYFKWKDVVLLEQSWYEFFIVCDSEYRGIFENIKNIQYYR